MRTFLLLLLAVLAAADACAKRPDARVVVVLDSHAGELHSGLHGNAAYTLALQQPAYIPSGQFGVPVTTADVVAGAFGNALAGLVVNNMVAHQQQLQADAAIAPLLALLTRDQVMRQVQAGVRDALRAQGIDDVEFVLAGEPDPKLLERMKVGPNVERILFVDSDSREGWSSSLVALTSDNRSVRIAMRVEDLHRNGRRFGRPTTRRFNVFTAPLAESAPHLAMNARLASGSDALGAQIREGTGHALALLAVPDDLDVADAEVVRFVNRIGAYQVPGRLLDHEAGMIRVVDHKGNVAVYWADHLL